MFIKLKEFCNSKLSQLGSEQWNTTKDDLSAGKNFHLKSIKKCRQ
jgi:hypothetical protein